MSREEFLSNFLDIINVSRRINSRYKQYLKIKTFDVTERFAEIAASGYRGSPEEKLRFKRWIINHAKGVRSRYGNLATPIQKKQFLDELRIGFGSEKMRYETRAGTSVPEGIPEVPLLTYDRSGNLVDKIRAATATNKYQEIDYRKARPIILPLSSKTRSQLSSLILGKVSKDVNSEYYEQLKNAGVANDIINALRKSMSEGDMTDSEYDASVNSLTKYVEGFNNQRFRSRTEGGALALTTGERRLIRLNNLISSVLIMLVKRGTIKTFRNSVSNIVDRFLPKEYRSDYKLPSISGQLTVGDVAGSSYAQDLKTITDEGGRLVSNTLTPKLSSGKRMTVSSYKTMMGHVKGLGVNSESFRDWFHNTSGEIILFKYSMSYGSHFTWLSDRELPFDICDVYSGQFFQSEEGHPYLDNEYEEPTKDMYDFNGGLIIGAYESAAAIYNSMKEGRARTINSFNFPREGESTYPVVFTMGELIAQFVATGLSIGFFKNVYLIWDLPSDHPNGWCTVIPIFLRALIKEQKLKVPEPERRVPIAKPELLPDVVREKRIFKEKIVDITSSIIGNYVWNKRDKRGNIIESKSFSDKLQLEIEKALPEFEKLLGIREAWTLDYKRKIMSSHYTLKKAVTGQMIDEYGLASKVLVKDFSSVLSKKDPIKSFYTPQGDTVDGWLSSVLRKEGLVTRRIVSKQMVSLRRHTYRYRVVVAGKPTTITSGVGDLIFYTKNMEYWRMRGMPKGVIVELVAEQTANAIGQNIMRTARVGNHLKRQGKEKLTKMFYKRLREIKATAGSKVQRLADRYHRAKELSKQVELIFEYMVKEPELFKKEFSEVFKFLVEKTRYKLKDEIRSRLLDSLYEGIANFYTK